MPEKITNKLAQFSIVGGIAAWVIGGVYVVTVVGVARNNELLKAIYSPLLIPLWLVIDVLAIGSGIVAGMQVKRSRGKQAGNSLATGGIVIAGANLFISVVTIGAALICFGLTLALTS
jgi:hypothetical protein